MGHHFINADRDQVFLLPPDIRDWLPSSHLVWSILGSVDQFDMSEFEAKYRADGRGGGAYHPRVMVAILLYAYAMGVTSSRKIEQKLHEDVAFRVVGSNLTPDHSSIAAFRKRHEDQLPGLFTQVLSVCAVAGIVKVGRLALDGTKMGAMAALSANRRLESIETQVRELLAEADRVDAQEDALYGADNRGDELPEELRSPETRLARLKAAKRRLDEEAAQEDAQYAKKLEEREQQEAESGQKLRGRKPKDPAKDPGRAKRRANTTDPDSRVMPLRGGGFLQGYNAQAITNDNQIIICTDVVCDTNDTQQLHPMIERVRQQLHDAGITEAPGILLADAGYVSETVLEGLTPQDPDCYIATRNHRRNPKPRNGTRGPLPKDASLVEKMDRKVSTKKGKEIYQDRQWMIEPVFGQIKTGTGIKGFARRGLKAVKAEWALIAASHNLKKLWRHGLPATT